MTHKEVSCPVCGCTATQQADFTHLTAFYECPVCGRFELKYPAENSSFNRNHLAAYLSYHKFDSQKMDEYRYHTVLDKEYCDQHRKEFDRGNNICGRPVHMDGEMVENWFPKTFSERVDKILLYLAEHSLHIGQEIRLDEPTTMAVLFVDLQEKDTEYYSETKGQWIKRSTDEYRQEANYMLDFLKSENYIQDYGYGENDLFVLLSPKGYARVDELQKNTSHGRNVLVAMKFGDDTKPLREAIRQGIQEAGYLAIFIDEVQHNDFITPELLKHIRDSKFVVVDLTHQNNGAYFEEGYAMGLGKPVIQLCRDDTDLHFDIAQKNTIIWKTEDEIPHRLKNRILATIE